jgi:recombination protein RecT
MSESTQLAESRPQNVRQYLELPAYKARFGEVLGQRAPQFMASLVTLSNDATLSACEPRSIIAAAMIAATLDFPIEKSLGFCHVVGYAGKAQFQMAAKGYVQLALRSGQYHRLNAKPVNAEAFAGCDEVGEPIIRWELLDETKPPAGYAVAWKLANGFTKVAYWPREKVEAHAKKFSRAYAAGKKDSPWFTNFDKMALKTVVMNELRAWGILSVQMQKAMVHDQAVHEDIDAEPVYEDGPENVTLSTETPAEPAQPRPPAPPRAKKGAAAVVENAKKEQAQQQATIDVETTQAVDKAIVEQAKAHVDANVKAMERKYNEATAPTGAQATPEPKKFTDGEARTCTCTVKGMEAGMLTYPDKSGTPVPTPSVSLMLEGEHTGNCWHPGGGEGTSKDNVKPLPIYAVGKSLKFTLKGRKIKSGAIAVVVDRVEELEGAAADLS